MKAETLTVADLSNLRTLVSIDGKPFSQARYRQSKATADEAGLNATERTAAGMLRDLRIAKGQSKADLMRAAKHLSGFIDFSAWTRSKLYGFAMCCGSVVPGCELVWSVEMWRGAVEHEIERLLNLP